MEFYKEGRVLTVTNGTRLDLSAAQYNHKAAVIISLAPATTDVVTLKFFTKGTKSTGVAFTAATVAAADVQTTNFTNNVIPVRLAEIDATAAVSPLTVTLFN